jgi:lipoprotein-releasing system permease protein
MGIDPETAPEVLTVLKALTSGSLAPLQSEARAVHEEAPATEFAAPKPPPQVVIGAELARALSVRVGDTIRVISPSLQTLTPLGPTPKSQGLRVAAVFSSKMYEYDSRYAYMTLGAARSFFERGDKWVTGLQLQTHNPDQVAAIGSQCLNALNDPELTALDWRSRNQTLFSALELERVVAFVVLVFIILVASFSIVTTLAMSVIEKRKEIAILKTMGSRDQDILKVFLIQGLLIGGFGTLAGAVAGVVTVALLGSFGLPIPSDVYYLDSLPVHLGTVDIVLVVLAALLIVWDFAVFPALEAARLQPIEGLREG